MDIKQSMHDILRSESEAIASIPYTNDYEKAVDFLQSAALHGNAFAERLLIEADEHNKAFEELRITNGVRRLFRSIARMLKEKTEEKGKGGIALTDKKLRRKIEEKKQAQGLRHE